LVRWGEIGLRCGAARDSSGLDSKDGSNWSALKLKAMPAMRLILVGLGWQQLTPWGGSTGMGLENIFLLFVRSHGKKRRGNNHSEKNQS